jgi:hypothetical protein
LRSSLVIVAVARTPVGPVAAAAIRAVVAVAEAAT